MASKQSNKDITMKTVKARVPRFLREEKKKNHPRTHFDFDTLPEARKWEVGSRYVIKMEVEQVGMHDDDGMGMAEFEIRKIGGKPVNNPDKKDRVSRKRARNDGPRAY